MTTIPTYTGAVEADGLGRTLMHEHVFVGDPELDRALPHPEWDRQRAVDSAVATMERLHAAGVHAVVDLTVPGLGRDVALVAEVAARSPVRIIAATGWYSVTALPPAIRSHGPETLVGGEDPLTQLFVRDIEQGIAGTDVRAALIKVASDSASMGADAARTFSAAAHAHHRTGVAITTHSDAAARGGLAQQDLLASLGVPLDRVVIGHSGDATDLDYLRTLADRGSYLGFDRFGMEHVQSDASRVESLLALVESGYADRIVLSHDAAVFSRVTPPSWRARTVPRWHMTHLTDTILPLLLARGLTAAQVDHMMVHTPRRLLSPA